MSRGEKQRQRKRLLCAVSLLRKMVGALPGQFQVPPAPSGSPHGQQPILHCFSQYVCRKLDKKQSSKNWAAALIWESAVTCDHRLRAFLLAANWDCAKQLLLAGRYLKEREAITNISHFLKSILKLRIGLFLFFFSQTTYVVLNIYTNFQWQLICKIIYKSKIILICTCKQQSVRAEIIEQGIMILCFDADSKCCFLMFFFKLRI